MAAAASSESIPPAPVIHSWPGPLTQPPAHTSDVMHTSGASATSTNSSSTTTTGTTFASSSPLDEIGVALARFGGPLSSHSFLTVFNSIACDVVSLSGLAVDEPSAPAVSPGFGSPQDLEFRRLYATVMSFLFQQHIRANELAGQREKLTAFSCPPNKAPSIPIRDYIERVMRYTPGTKELYLAALMLIDRLLEMHPRLRLTLRNVHRLFMISVVVSSKLLDDLFFTNRFLSAVAGLPTPELNRLEVQFLIHLRFSLYLRLEDFEDYRRPFEHLVSIARTHGDLPYFFHEAQRFRHSQAPRVITILDPIAVASSASVAAAAAAAPTSASVAAASASVVQAPEPQLQQREQHSKISKITSRLKSVFTHSKGDRQKPLPNAAVVAMGNQVRHPTQIASAEGCLEGGMA